MMNDERNEPCEDPDIAAALERLRKRVEADKAVREVRQKWNTRIGWAAQSEDSQPDS